MRKSRSIDKKDSGFDLTGTGDTTGKAEGTFYGSKADIAVGKVDFGSKNSKIELEGTFEATKQ